MTLITDGHVPDDVWEQATASFAPEELALRRRPRRAMHTGVTRKRRRRGVFGSAVRR
jgi:hypothetical protein